MITTVEHWEASGQMDYRGRDSGKKKRGSFFFLTMTAITTKKTLEKKKRESPKSF